MERTGKGSGWGELGGGVPEVRMEVMGINGVCMSVGIDEKGGRTAYAGGRE